MNISKYKETAIDLFKSGKASDEQWTELGGALLFVSETSGEIIKTIDNTIDPLPLGTCPKCYYENAEESNICENCSFKLHEK